jgi:hypothetical protein
LFSNDGSGSVEVLPTPPAAPAAPAITIDAPSNGATVDNTGPFTVRGTGAALPEGNVIVQAIDGNNTLLAEAPTTVQAPDAGTGGAGPWEVQLSVSTPPGTLGRVRAFSTSPADGAVLADTSVSVYFGAPAAQQPAVVIDAPQSGAVVDPQAIVVSGSTDSAPRPEVVVQTLTAQNEVMGSVIAPVDANGRWQATVQSTAQPGSPGQIAALLTAADGAEVAVATVGVIFGAAPAVQPSVTIDVPLSGEVVSPVEIVVSGSAVGAPDPVVSVQALNANNEVLVRETVPIDAGGRWQATLRPNAEPGSSGQITAITGSAADRSVAASAAVAVTFGEAQPAAPAITIGIPLPGETVSPVEIVVVGAGTALPENNVVVQIRGPDGAVLAEAPATVAAAVGGSGEWRATLQPNAPQGSPGTVYAFAPSPADGSIVAEATVDVVFGGAAPEVQAGITITAPVANAVVDPANLIVVGAGTALPENNVVVRVLGQDGAVIAEAPTVVNADVGGTGAWSINFSLDLLPGTLGQIYAFSPSPADGSILAEAAVPVQFGAAP